MQRGESSQLAKQSPVENSRGCLVFIRPTDLTIVYDPGANHENFMYKEADKITICAEK